MDAKWHGSTVVEVMYKDADRFEGRFRNGVYVEVRKHGHVLTPGRYVGAQLQDEEDEPFEEKMKRLVAQLREQLAGAARLDAAIDAKLPLLLLGEGLGMRVEHRRCSLREVGHGAPSDSSSSAPQQ